MQSSELQLRGALGFAIEIWNMCVIASQSGVPVDAAMVRADFAGTPVLEWAEHLIARKRERFADDLRIVGDWYVQGNQDRFDVQMETRVSKSLHAQLEAAGVPLPASSI